MAYIYTAKDLTPTIFEALIPLLFYGKVNKKDIIIKVMDYHKQNGGIATPKNYEYSVCTALRRLAKKGLSQNCGSGIWEIFKSDDMQTVENEQQHDLTGIKQTLPNSDINVDEIGIKEDVATTKEEGQQITNVINDDLNMNKTIKKESNVARRWKSLVYKEGYANMSCNAKVLYTRMEDKCTNNGSEDCFVDMDGRYYFKSTREKLSEIGGIPIETVEMIVDELKENELIIELIAKGGEIRIYLTLDYKD